MWRYQQSTGQIFQPNGKLLSTGYSGAPGHVNRPESEALRMFGPIPRGQYEVGPAFTHSSLGQLSMRLRPIGHDAHGRAAFLIHGDNRFGNQSGSHGCIIMDRLSRSAISRSPDKILEVF